jgi:hypothetical protein
MLNQPFIEKNIKGKPYITVSAKGIANGLSNIPNNGADFGPDTMLNATDPSQIGPPYTQTSGLQEAINYASQGSKILMKGQIILNTTVNVNKGLTIEGENDSNVPPLVTVAGNFAGFNVTTSASLRNFFITGSNNSSYTSQDLILINNTNSVEIENIWFAYGYNDIRAIGTSFYLDIHSCYFYSAINDIIYFDGNVDAQLDNIEGFVNNAVNGLELNGAASIIATNVRFTGNMTGAALMVDSVNSNAGTFQFSECVFENITGGHGVVFQGTSSAPVGGVGFYFDNCDLSGNNNNGYHGVVINYAKRIFIFNSHISGYYGIYFPANAVASIISIIGNMFDGPNVPIFCNGNGTTSGSANLTMVTIANNIYGGTYPFFYASALPGANLNGIYISHNIFPNMPSTTAALTYNIPCTCFFMSNIGDHPSVSTPSIPASGTAQSNNTPYTVEIYLSGGSATGVQITRTGTTYTVWSSSSATAIPPLVIRLNPNDSITITYTTAPTWTWVPA